MCFQTVPIHTKILAETVSHKIPSALQNPHNVASCVGQGLKRAYARNMRDPKRREKSLELYKIIPL